MLTKKNYNDIIVISNKYPNILREDAGCHQDHYLLMQIMIKDKGEKLYGRKNLHNEKEWYVSVSA